MELRPIQNEALAATMDSFKSGGTYHMIQEPVAFGKTVLASALIKKAVIEHGVTCLFLAHLKELILQTEDKFKQIAPEIPVSVLCGGLGRSEVGQVTIGTRQTVAGHLGRFSKVSLIIIDEVHLYSEQYQLIVDYFLKKNPKLRVLGVTGTPYKLGKGFVYGDSTIWGDLAHQTTMTQMIKMGFLSKFRYKIEDTVKQDLKSIGKVGGEYNEGELGEMMAKEIHMRSVEKALNDYAGERKCVLVFAVTIDHAEALARVLGCEAIHSKLKKDVWRKRVDDFKSGAVRMLVNVSQLSIGFDCPSVDCVVFARPTQSPALFVQMAGRGLRIEEKKIDCLILDLVGNYSRHGLPSNPKIRKKGEREAKEPGDPACKICEECFEVLPAATKICPSCGFEQESDDEIIDSRIEMKEVEEQKNPKVSSRWVKENHTTRKGFAGKLLCMKLDTGKTLFKFVSNGTSAQNRIDKFLKIREGSEVMVTNTAYGDWIE